MKNNKSSLKIFLEKQVEKFNCEAFIENDPISIPHGFLKKQDQEISAFFASIFAWGQRKTIINKTKNLMQRMDNQPHDFVLNHSEKDLKNLIGFKHRTFNETDLLYFVDFLKRHYQKNNSLENAFSNGINSDSETIELGLINFYKLFFEAEYAPRRSQKHISTPAKKSACKRLNMFLRWMVRQDKKVDLGIWKQIKPHQLILPLDVHVLRTALELKLISSEKPNWNLALELTKKLKQFDKADPVKYDFALFGSSIFQ